jgi:uncharacterized protein (DUF2235 family)
MKHIVICSDGTGNTAIKGRGTNVFKLYEAVDLEGHRTNNTWPRQIGFYDDGVGTARLKALALLFGAFGVGLGRNVRQLYADLARVYDPGDRIFLFGFSRGAFTVRTLNGFIAACGLIDRAHCTSDDDLRKKVYSAYRAYRDRYRTRLAQLFRGAASNAPESVRSVRTSLAVQHAPEHRRPVDRTPDGQALEAWQVPITFIGVWDTVDAVGFPVPGVAELVNETFYRFKFPDHHLGPTVQRARHALAVDDERGTFHPLLWNEQRETSPATPPRIEQVWFSGAHSNVGGGYPKQGMSLVALEWMMAEAEQVTLRFSATDRKLYQERQNVYDKLYDSRGGTGFFYRYQPRDIAKLCRDNHVTPKVHASAVERVLDAPQGYAPANIPRDAVITGPSAPALPALLQRMRRDLRDGDSSLLDRVRAWIGLRRATQGLVIVLAIVVLGMALRQGSLSAFDLSLWGLLRGVVTFISDAVAGARWWVLALLAAMLVAYVINWAATRKMKTKFSTFWFSVRR